jgi:hypothetical protein
MSQPSPAGLRVRGTRSLFGSPETDLLSRKEGATLDVVSEPGRRTVGAFVEALGSAQAGRGVGNRRKGRLYHGGAAVEIVAARGNNGNARRSFGFGHVRRRGRVRLNDADCAHWHERNRTLRRVDKLGVTGSSPVPPTRKRPAKAGLSFAQSRTTRRPCPQNVRSGAERSRLRRFPAEISSSATKTDEFAN